MPVRISKKCDEWFQNKVALYGPSLQPRRVRKIILGASPQISEGIKWNAPSFRTTEYFATFHLRSQDRVQLVFHRGAKVKAPVKRGLEIADPAGLMKWLAADRALVTVGANKEIAANKRALENVVKAWIKHLSSPE